MHTRRKFFKGVGSALGLLSLPQLGFGSKPERLPQSFSELRAQLLVPEERVYLNTGSLGPSPMAVVETITESMKTLEANPVVENWGELGQKMEEVRLKVAEFINAPPEDIILTRNTTEGLSLIGQSIELKEGDEIVTTTREHGGGEVGFEFLAEKSGATFRKFELPMPANSKSVVIQTIEKEIRPNTKLLVLSHVNTITGMKMPLTEISALARERDCLFIVDGAQAPGLVDVDIQTSGVDGYASSGHKWMLGPKETGFLYLSKRIQDHVKPVFTSKGYASYSASSGTRNVAQFIGLGKTIDVHKNIGTKTIEDRCLEIGKYCLTKLKGIKGLRIISPESDELRTGIVSVALESSKNAEIANILKGKEIIVKVLPGNNALRFSCHAFTSTADIDKLTDELSRIMR